MKKPQILAFLPFLVKGALSIKILRALVQKDFNITVAFYMDISSSYTVDPLKDFIANDRLINLVRTKQNQRLAFLKKEIDKRNINLILQIGASDLYLHLPYLKEHKPDISIIDILYNEYGHTMNHFLYENCIDGVIVEHFQMKQFVEQATLKSNPNVHILHSGVDLDTFTPIQREPRESSLAIGYIGRMSDEKNPLGFVDLAEQLCELLPNINFRMFGEGAQTYEIKKRISESKLGSKLTFAGYVEDVKVALAQIDVLILPSKFDGRPNIIMEANACGIPVIAAPVGGVPEMIFEGINGYLLSPQETIKIKNVLSTLSNNPKALQALKESSRTVAISNFNDKIMNDNYATALVSFVSPDNDSPTKI